MKMPSLKAKKWTNYALTSKGKFGRIGTRSFSQINKLMLKDKSQERIEELKRPKEIEIESL